MTQTILIADDERLLRRTLKRALAREGFSILVAENGTEAVQLYSENKESIDLCILDLNMPMLSGTEALHQIRSICDEANVVISSGESKEEILARCSPSQPNGILQKPFALDKLLQEVQSFLL